MDITLQEIAELVDSTRGANYFANQFESSLKPLFKKLNDVEKDTSKLDISKLLHVDENLMPKFKRRYEKALESFLDGFEKKIKEFNKTGMLESVLVGNKGKDTKSKVRPPRFPVIPPTFPNNQIKSKPKKGLDIENESNKIPVHIESINKNLMSKLGVGVSSAVSVVNNDRSNEGKGGSGKGLLGLLGRFAGLSGLGLIALTAGALALYKGFNDDGKLKGLLKIIGKQLVTMGSNLMGRVFSTMSDIFGTITSSKVIANAPLKIPKLASLFNKVGNLSKLAGKGATIVFKGIPWLGSIIGLAFAYSRFKAGDNLGGILEIASSLVSIAPIPYLSSAIDLFLAYRDVTTTKRERGAQLGNITQGIHNWLSQNKLYRAYFNVYSGIAMFLSARTGADIDKAIARFRQGNSMLLEVFPVAQYILSVVDFFKSGGATKLAKRAGSTISDYFMGKWMWNILSKGLDMVWGFVSQHLSAIADSNTGKFIGLLIKEKTIQFKLKMVSVIDKVLDLINIIPTSINEVYNGSIKTLKDKLPNFVIDRLPSLRNLGNNDILPDLGSSKLKNDIYKKQLLDDLDSVRSNQLKVFEKKEEAKRIEELKEAAIIKKNQERMHKESMEMAAATLLAIQEQTGVTAASNSGNNTNTGSSPTTIIYQGSNERGSNRVRDISQQTTYPTGVR